MKKFSPNTRFLRALLARKGQGAAEVRKLFAPTTLARHRRGVMPTAKHIIEYEMAFGWRARDWQTPREWARSARRTHALPFGHVKVSVLPDSVYNGFDPWEAQ